MNNHMLSRQNLVPNTIVNDAVTTENNWVMIMFPQNEKPLHYFDHLVILIAPLIFSSFTLR